MNWPVSSKVAEIAGSEVPGSSRLRMLITVLVASNWVTIHMMLLHMGGLVPFQQAAEISLYVAGTLFAAHLTLSRLPKIARSVQSITGSNTGGKEDRNAEQ